MTITTSKSKLLGLIFIIFSLIAVTVSCTTTHQARSTKKSGFLGDYSQLQPGDSDEAQLIYINPSAEFGQYNKILIEPISVYTSEVSDLTKLPKEDLQSLIDYLHATLQEQLQKDYEIVSSSGPGTMRLRVAITEAEGSDVVLDTLSSTIPIGVAASGLKRAAVGTNLNVGKARIEAEMVDAQTNERLFAVVDARAGRKYTGKFDKWKEWQDARDSYDYWAKRVKMRLAELRSK